MDLGMNFGVKDNVISVCDVNRYVKLLMENDALLSAISVRGEISNLKYHTSGHLYFTLKDEESELSAVMFRSSVNAMRFVAKNGMRVTVYGRISVYEKSGKYQLYATAMTDDGVGRLQLEYERLLAKLRAEGLFDDKRKKPLPRIPKTVGIITSPTGAAIRDMLNVTGRRWRSAKIVIYPSLVQGDAAPQELCRGLEYLNAARECDVIIIGRGGGSIEDLWAFNDERVVRAVAASSIPVISAVGHETDFTLCDFAADCRAPTPSAAAELAVPDATQVGMRIDESFMRIEASFERMLSQKRRELEAFARQLSIASPEGRLIRERDALRRRYELIVRCADEAVAAKKQSLISLADKLATLNPLAVLTRGYSMALKDDGGVVSSVSSVDVGESIRLVFADGEARATVMGKNVKRKARKELRGDGNG